MWNRKYYQFKDHSNILWIDQVISLLYWVSLMRTILIIILAISGVMTSASNAAAGWQWKRCWTGNCYSYQQVFVADNVAATGVAAVQSAAQTTVVNNLIGIPVPVQYSEPIAAQGSTVYGYSSLAQSYNQVDMGLLYNQAARLTDQAQQLAGQAATDFSSIVQSEGQNRAEVAKIIAQGQAAREALTATKGDAPQQINRSFAFRVTQDTKGEMKIEKADDFSLMTKGSANISELLTNKCLSCHNANAKGGNLDLSGEISDIQQLAILKRVTTEDLDKRMPRRPDGTAGNKLSSEELGTVLNAMSGSLHHK